MLPTVQDLQRSQRYLDRLLKDKEKALTAMRQGATLHRQHGPRHGPVSWWLSNGTELRAEVCAALTRDPHVVGVGDAFFGRELSQTFRYCDVSEADEGGPPDAA